MMLNCHAKNELKRSSLSGDILCKRIKQSNWPGKFWGQNLRARLLKLLEITESICCYSGSLPMCEKSASKLNSVLTYCIFNIAYLILGITFDMPRYAWPYSYEWTESRRCTYQGFGGNGGGMGGGHPLAENLLNMILGTLKIVFELTIANMALQKEKWNS